MIDFSKENGITVIAGDILEVYFLLENIDNEQVENVIFSCADKGIEVVCAYSEEEKGFCLRLESEDTAALECGLVTYDLTIKYPDGNYFTAVYENALNVLPKRNKVSEV